MRWRRCSRSSSRHPPAAAVRAVEPLRSVFLRGLLAVLHAGMPANVVQSG